MVENLPKLKIDLMRAIRALGLPSDFYLELRGYSKAYNGLYYPTEKKVVLYVRSSYGKLYNWRRLMSTLIHEAVHHYQFAHDPKYTRVKGTMHNKDFKELYEEYYAKFVEMEEKAV